ncbi:hypothetical protein Y1Q_0007398 [Alligator mississippiensis]|uniref:Uncharacterized protein n=1 Tax=Alligator mississippiensis TaxID=8496 RepID=A0A151P7V1_ALLMI|nr:hypothetical protein Y1Q_0007398 [Alligator mississippiensis]
MQAGINRIYAFTEWLRQKLGFLSLTTGHDEYMEEHEQNQEVPERDGVSHEERHAQHSSNMPQGSIL